MTRTEFNPAKLGVFVIGALLLAVLAVVLWGPLNNLWQKKYVIFFDEKATGLDEGATVRLNGVAIGKVDSIDLFYDQNNKVYSAVVVQLDRKKVRRISKGGQSFDDMLRNKEISAELGISGVVSFKLDVQLTIEPLKTGGYRRWKYSEYKEYYGEVDWIPARQSTIAMVMEKVRELFNNSEITNLLSSVNRLLDESSSNHLVYNATAALSNFGVASSNANLMLLSNQDDIRTIASKLAQLSTHAGPKLDILLGKLNAAADSVNTNLADFGTNTDLMSSNFFEIRTNLEARSAELSVVLNGAAALPPQTAETMRQLQGAIESLQRLIDYVERHPDALWRGRAKEK